MPSRDSRRHGTEVTADSPVGPTDFARAKSSRSTVFMGEPPTPQGARRRSIILGPFEFGIATLGDFFDPQRPIPDVLAFLAWSYMIQESVDIWIQLCKSY